MVAIIKTGPSIHRTFNYNEQKVKDGVARCIGAINYPKDLEHLSISNRLNRLLNQAALNENVTRNSVHISLNFDPSEHHSTEKLQQIASAYMEGIGFGGQPYLVYQHHDAGHPHLHIVSIKIREDGKRIDTQNIGRNQSETVRKAIEKRFGLVVAEGHKRAIYNLKPIPASKVRYGPLPIKSAIQNVLNTVVNEYKYTSLPEFNAVLRQYNVLADRGSEGSRIYKNGGLVYRVLDADGNKIGVPIKASDFNSKPTLKHLEQRFAANESGRANYKSRVRTAIDLALQRNNGPSVSSFILALQSQGIAAVLRQNEAGMVYGITYVDHKTKCVFNGSSLGKEYSAKRVLERCNRGSGDTASLQQKVKEATGVKVDSPVSDTKTPLHNSIPKTEIKTDFTAANTQSILSELIEPANIFNPTPFGLKKKRKKKRKSNHL